MFLRSTARRVIAVALASLLAATFLVSVGASVAQLPVGNILDAGNPLLRIFPATRADATEVASTDATAQETSEDSTDEAQDTEDEGVAFDAAFVHRAEPANTVGNSTYLDDPSINGDPDAFISVTHNWNPGGGAGIYNDHPVGVWYDPNRLGWAIFNQDMASMPEGVAFNVVVLRSPVEVG